MTYNLSSAVYESALKEYKPNIVVA